MVSPELVESSKGMLSDVNAPLPWIVKVFGVASEGKLRAVRLLLDRMEMPLLTPVVLAR